MARVRRGEQSEPGFRVTEVPLERSRAFVTVGPDAHVWKVLEAQHLPPIPPGSFVRLEPPGGDASTDEEVERVRRMCAEAGAVHVFDVPRRRAADVLEPRGEIPAGARPRDVVLQLVEESSLPEKGALRDLCEEILSRRKL